VWFIGSGVSFGILVVQSIFGKYGENVDAAWSWFIPTVVPTLSLMIGVMGAAAIGSRDRRKVKINFFEIALWVSITYLVVLVGTIVLEPFSPMEALTLMKMSNYWLGPIQGLAVGAIAVVFVAQGEPTSGAGSK